ncbi:SpoIIE family protein phosphatase [Streptomyces atratus]|uniref:SpoIIE family protein phosphatase n=1 Tax=Streptomyces atratus TaxID=1893 RepID=UPI001E4F851C|nr:SpoIIE family protein phosphatase [Streptomyces atratus]WPW27125.1 SpoIIE family protein phosphatase [Streptomyces atratus]
MRGKGLAAIGEAALLLGAFREAAHQHTGLPALAAALEQSISPYQADFEPEEEAGERFATVLLLEIPDQGRISRMTSCGHPAPLLLSPGHAVTVPSLHPARPLGVGGTGPTVRIPFPHCCLTGSRVPEENDMRAISGAVRLCR